MYGERMTLALFVGRARTIDGKWSACCCALVDVHQNKVPILQVLLSEVHNKTTEISGTHFSSLDLNM